MPILKAFRTPGGASLNYHVAQRVEAQTLDAAQVLMVSVASWPSVQDYDAADGKSATWVDWYPAPFIATAAAAAQGLALAVEQALTNSPDSAFEGGVLVAAGDGLEGAKARQWANIKLQRDFLDREPVSYQDFQVDADDSSRMDLMGALMAMQLSGQATRLWRCTDNIMRELTVGDLASVGQAIAARRQSLIEVSDDLYQQIQAATDMAAVAAITWPM